MLNEETKVKEDNRWVVRTLRPGICLQCTLHIFLLFMPLRHAKTHSAWAIHLHAAGGNRPPTFGAPRDVTSISQKHNNPRSGVWQHQEVCCSFRWDKWWQSHITAGQRPRKGTHNVGGLSLCQWCPSFVIEGIVCHRKLAYGAFRDRVRTFEGTQTSCFRKQDF